MIKKIKEFVSNSFTARMIIAGIFINVFCLCLAMCSPQVVHAASEQTYFPMEQNGNSRWTSGLISQLETQVNASQNYYIAKLWWNQNAARSQVSVIYWAKDSDLTFDGRIASNGYEWSIYKHGSGTYYYSGWWHSWQDPTINGRYNNTNSGMENVAGISSVYDGRNSYISNINVMNAQAPRSAILWFEIPTYIPDGAEPTAPDLSGLDLDSSLNTTQVPTAPTYSNNFNDPIPTWDSTAPFESLFDIVMWGFNRAYSMFNAFREYFFSWLGYFVNILTYLIQKIIDAIKYIVTWFYNQFLNWLNPYLNIIRFISGLLFNEDEQKSVWDLMFEFFGAVAQWLAQFWQNSFIVNFWTNYVSNLEDIVEDILDKIDDVITSIDYIRLLFTRDPDYSLILTQFYTTYIGRCYQAIMRLLGAIHDGIVSIQAPATLSFTVNFSSAPAPFNQVGLLTFDFGWYENIRNVIVPIVTTCVYFSFGLHLIWSWRAMLSDTASLKPETTVTPIGSTPVSHVSYSYSSGSSGGKGGLVPTWRTYPGQKRIRG